MHLRRCAMALVCAAFVSTICFAQSPSFTTVTSVSGPSPAHMYALDVNNDGFTDIVQDSANPGTTGSYFSISLNNGNGTFKAPVRYRINSSTWTPITWGDFNNDGKVDIAVVLPGTSQVAIYLGNGDGTFKSPITTTIALPSGVTFAPSSIVAADFNHDGNIDLVAAANKGGLWSVYLLEGDGAGRFVNPTVIYNPTSGWQVMRIVDGDFDTDGNADVALLEEMPCGGSGGTYCFSNVVALFGNGHTYFVPQDVTSGSGTMTLGSADLNNDGATDLFGIEYGSSQMGYFLGNYGRRFTYNYSQIPANGGIAAKNIVGPFAVSNFSGNTNLVARTATYSSSGTATYGLIFFLTSGSGGNSSIFNYPSPAGSAQYQIGPVAGNFNGDLQPDIAVSGSSSTQSSTSTLAVGLNNTSGYGGEFGLCNYPMSGQGIHVCSPSAQTTSGETTFAVSANSFGQLRKIELWLNGKKQGEEHYVWGPRGYFDYFFDNLAPGAYHATIYAADIDNRLQRYDYTVDVGSACGPPPQGAYGVNICSPTFDGTYTDPVPVIATAKISGTFSHMELWVDGAKQYTESNSTTLKTSVTLSQSYHDFVVYAYNTAGQKWETEVAANAMLK